MFDKCKEFVSKRAKAISGAIASLALILTALPTHAQDYSASTTAAIQDAGETVIGMFFANLPIILGFVIAIVLTLWGIRWIMSQFHRGGRR